MRAPKKQRKVRNVETSKKKETAAKISWVITDDPPADLHEIAAGVKEIRKTLNSATIKPRLSLIPPDAIEMIGLVLGWGEQQYGNTWEEGVLYRDRLDKALRHLTEFNKGKSLDTESNLPVLAHAAAQILFLLAYELRGMTQFDDRSILVP